MRFRTLIGVTQAILVVGFGFVFTHRTEHVENSPIVLGHGGMGIRSTYPLNSIESVNEALSNPIQGIELDVRMTADGVLMAFHDQDLSENTNCVGQISDLESEYVSNCISKTWLRSAHVASLQEIFSQIRSSDLHVSLDIKLEYGTDIEVRAMSEALKALTEQFREVNFFIESSNVGFLQALQNTSIKADLFLSSQLPEMAIDTAIEHQFSGIVVEMNSITESQISKAQEENLYVMIWGCGSVFDNRKALSMHPDLIQTDDIWSMMRILKTD